MFTITNTRVTGIAVVASVATLTLGAAGAWADSWGADSYRAAGSPARPNDRGGTLGIGATTASGSTTIIRSLQIVDGGSLDRRSPDTRDAAAARQVDLRSPDTRDASGG